MGEDQRVVAQLLNQAAKIAESARTGRLAPPIEGADDERRRLGALDLITRSEGRRGGGVALDHPARSQGDDGRASGIAQWHVGEARGATGYGRTATGIANRPTGVQALPCDR